jgi:hypothetical protein
MAEDLILCPACLERIIPLDTDRCECGECPICAGYFDDSFDEKPADHQHTSQERAYVRQLYWVAPDRVDEVRAGIRRCQSSWRHFFATVVSVVGMTIAIFGIAGLCFWVLRAVVPAWMGGILTTIALLVGAIPTYFFLYRLVVPSLIVGEPTSRPIGFFRWWN